MTQVKDLVEFDDRWYATANDEERQMFRDWLLKILASNESVTIKFTKADGSDRTMNCTTKNGSCPVVENKKTSNSLCTVWDIDLQQWRSFKFENIKEINFTL